jgi:hypothetical protein
MQPPLPPSATVVASSPASAGAAGWSKSAPRREEQPDAAARIGTAIRSRTRLNGRTRLAIGGSVE